MKKIIYIIVVVILIALAAVFLTRKSADRYFYQAQKEQSADKKIELFTKAISLNKNLKKAYIARGKVYLKLGEPGYYMTFLFSLHNGNIGDYRKDYLSKALADLERLEYKEKHFDIGRIYLLMHNYKNSLSELDKALKITPASFEIQLFKACAYAGLEDYDKTSEILTGIIDSSPDKSKVFRMLAKLYEKKKDHNKALGNYRKAFDYSSDVDMLYDLAYVFIRLQDWTYADKAVERLSKTGYRKNSAYVLMAAYQWRRYSDKTKTIDYIKKASASDAREFRRPAPFPLRFFEGLENDPEFNEYLPKK